MGCGASGDIIDMNTKAEKTPRRRIPWTECLRHELSDMGKRIGVCFALHRRTIGIWQIDDAMHNDATPAEQALYLIDLDSDPWVMPQHGDLGAGRDASMQPTFGVHVMNRLDVNVIMKRERYASDLS